MSIATLEPQTEIQTVQLLPPHSPGQRELIEWPGSGVVFAGRRWGKCLASGQRVHMADGTVKPIQDVRVGDMVLSLDVEAMQLEPKQVLAVMDNGVRDIVTVSEREGNFRLQCTPNHPFLSRFDWVEAQDLVPMQKVTVAVSTTAVQWTYVTSVEPAGKAQTWDLTVADNHNFIAEGFIVHNTEAFVQRILMHQAARPGMYWWVGLSWKSASMKRAWRLLEGICTEAIKAARGNVNKSINRSNFEIRLPNGSEIWMRTAERPESLAGEGIMGAVIDEFTLMPERVWSEYLEGTLLDHDGWALFGGVPKGKNWGATLYNNAASRKGWKQWSFTTYDNPIIDKDLIDAVRENTPERIFNQEYLAMVIDDAGSVFRGIMDIATATPQEERIEGHDYCAGIDWARTTDFSCFTIMDVTTKELVYMDRFNQIDYDFQTKRFKKVFDLFKPTIVKCELNAMGQPLFDTLASQGYPVVGFHTSQQSKDLIIKGLALAIERKTIRIIPDDVLINELQSYEMERTATGNWKYSAPQGGHDDTVMSLALCYSIINDYVEPVLVSPIGISKASSWRRNGY